MIGSEAGSSPTRSIATSLFWRAEAAQGGENGPAERLNGIGYEDGETKTEWENMTYGQYVREQGRRRVVDSVRCGPALGDGQRKLLFIALVLVQVAILIFLIDGGMFGGSDAKDGGVVGRVGVAAEVRTLLAVLALAAGIITFCYCLALRNGMVGEDAREVGPALSLRSLANIGPMSQPTPSRWEEKLRLMKAQLEPEFEVQNPTESVPARKYGFDRQRYSHLRDADEGRQVDFSVAPAPIDQGIGVASQ